MKTIARSGWDLSLKGDFQRPPVVGWGWGGVGFPLSRGEPLSLGEGVGLPVGGVCQSGSQPSGLGAAGNSSGQTGLASTFPLHP